MKGWPVLLCRADACAGTKLRAQHPHESTRIVARARQRRGALRAGRLAMAESHNDYAKQELSRGRLPRRRPGADGSPATTRSSAIDKSPKVFAATRTASRPRWSTRRPRTPTATASSTRRRLSAQARGQGRASRTRTAAPTPTTTTTASPTIDDCPNDPEDRDGFEDADGCPDPDNDGGRDRRRDRPLPGRPGGRRTASRTTTAAPTATTTATASPSAREAVDKCPAEAGPGSPTATEEVRPRRRHRGQIDSATVFFDTKKATNQEAVVRAARRRRQGPHRLPTIKVPYRATRQPRATTPSTRG